MSRRQTALVVEGGAMRGIFAAGVLDAFLAQGRTAFDHCIGVSAGAVNLAAFLAGQRGRNHSVITDYSCRPEFISLARFVRGGHWLDLDWLWAITIRECRLDLARFAANPVPLTVVATRVSDGQAAYLKGNAAELEQQIKASCSVPLVYRDFVRIGGEAMTDGGVADSIPVRHAYEQGAREITVVLSRPLGYRKRAPGATSAGPASLPAARDAGPGSRQPLAPSKLQRCHRLHPPAAGRLPHPGHSAAGGFSGWPHDHRPGATGAGLPNGLAGGPGLSGGRPGPALSPLSGSARGRHHAKPWRCRCGSGMNHPAHHSLY